jgi:hypothetical protein
MAALSAHSRVASGLACSTRAQQPSLRAPQRPMQSRRASVTVAALSPPQGVTQPPRQPTVPGPRFGFVDNAERINSRACMIGFFALLLVEAVSGRGLLELMGFTIGSGLGFEL